MGMSRIVRLAFLASLFCVAAHAEGIKPLAARINTADAERFQALWNAHDGRLTAPELQKSYLDPGSEAVKIFTPGRIKSAKNLAQKIAEKRADYERGLKVCLPAAKSADADLRAVFLGIEGLVPGSRLPRVYVLFGADNSGGTTGREAIVLGLEVVCRQATGDIDDVRAWLRRFFAHETIHTLQNWPDNATLLDAVLAEGGADYFASLVVGHSLNDKLDAWANAHREEIWRKFKTDIANPNLKTFGAWLYGGKRPEGWPPDVGYWLGARIAEAYMNKAADKQQAVRDILELRDTQTLLKASGYGDQFK